MYTQKAAPQRGLRHTLLRIHSLHYGGSVVKEEEVQKRAYEKPRCHNCDRYCRLLQRNPRQKVGLFSTIVWLALNCLLVKPSDGVDGGSYILQTRTGRTASSTSKHNLTLDNNGDGDDLVGKRCSATSKKPYLTIYMFYKRVCLLSVTTFSVLDAIKGINL